MAIQLQGANGVNINADATSNAARAVLYDSAGNPISLGANSVPAAAQKFLPIGGLVEGNFDGQRLDRLGNMRPDNDLLWLRDPIEGTTLNTQVWTPSTTTFSQAQVATTGLNFNSGNGVASGSYSIVTSNKQIPILGQCPLRARFRARVVPQTNAVAEFGFGAPVGTTAQITNGACWRYTSTGTVVPVFSYNGSDVAQGVDVSGLLSSSNYYTFEVVVTDQQIVFSIYNGSLLINQQTLNIPATQPFTWGVTHNTVFARLFTTGITSSAAYIYLRDTLVQGFDYATNKPWSHQLSSTGLGGDSSPTAFGQTANWANSSAATNATLSNTAAGYPNLGGLFSFVAVAGAATDYALFGLQIPAPYTFYMTGVHITAYNTGAAVATTPTLMHWGVYANSTGVSLASSTISRVPLGAQYFPIGAVIGQCADKDLDINFDAPLHTDSNRYVGIILRMPVATATASQVIQGSVLIKGYFE